MCSAEGELLAVIFALSKYHQYVGRSHFEIITDSKALTFLMSTKNLGAKLARWAIHIGQYNFTIIHKAGKQHTNADGLSRSEGATDDDEFKFSFLSDIHAVEVAEEKLSLPEEVGRCLETEVSVINVTR